MSEKSKDTTTTSSVMEDVLTTRNVLSRETVLSVGSVQFPSRIIDLNAEDSNTQNRVGIIMGHGLAERSHDSDDWTPLLIPGAILSSAPVSSITYYTARGHGATEGWQDSTDTDPDQFMWPRLAEDMVGIANTMGYEQCVFGGESMGSSTAFFAALQHPDRVKGIIMMRPPTAWETRAFQRDHLERKAKQFEESPSPRFPARFHKVLRATAKADYPPVTGPGSEIYATFPCPVLILAVRNDPVHPESTSIILDELLPKSELYIVDDHSQAVSTWPGIIKEFLGRIFS